MSSFATNWEFRPAGRWIAAFFVAALLLPPLPIPVGGYGPQFVWLDTGVYRRAQGLFYEASTLGNFCVFFLVMAAVGFTKPRGESPVSRKLLAAGSAVFFAALVLSYSRGSVVSLLVALAALGWLQRKRLRLWRIAPLAVLSPIAVWWLFPKFAELYWLRLSASA